MNQGKKMIVKIFYAFGNTVLTILILYFVSLSSSNENWRQIKVLYGTIVPSSLVVFEGQSASLHCAGDKPVTWYFPGEINFEYPNVERFTVILHNLTDTGIYTCSGEFATGQQFCEVTFVQVEKNPPIGMIVPSRVEVAEGSTIKLTCGSIKPVKWFSLNNTPNMYLEGNSLIIESINRNYSGPYLCRGFKANGTIFHQTVKVIVDGYLEIIPRPFHEYYLDVIHNFTGRQQAIEFFLDHIGD